MIEPLESRQLMASNYLQTDFGDAGVTTVRFRTTATDVDVRDTRIAVSADGSTYVLAKTLGTVQVRKLTTGGAIDTTWLSAQGNLMLFQVDRNTKYKMDVDAGGRLVLAIDNNLYRFRPSGQIDATFADRGVAKMSDFGPGKLDFSIDKAGKIYVTGQTSAANGILVERLLVRGRLDSGFGNRGRQLVPLPPVMTGLHEAAGNGTFVKVLADRTPSDTSDDKVLVTGLLAGGSYGNGIQATRLKANGSIDPTYGTQGTTAVLGPAANSSIFGSIRTVSILANGGVSTAGSRTFQDANGYPTSFGYVNEIISPNGVRHDADADITASSAYAGGGFAGISNNYVTRFDADAIGRKFNFGVVRGVQDIVVADIKEDDNLVLAALRPNGRVNVAVFKSSVDPLG